MDFNLLRYCSNEMYEIYANLENSNKFTVGYIIANDKNYIVCESIDPYGKKDGLVLFLCDNIIKVQKNTKYLNNIEKLYNKQGNKRDKIFFNTSESLLLQLLDYIDKNKKLCTIELCDSNINDVVGFLNKIDLNGATIELNNINDDGEKDGISIVNLNMISSITVDSLDDKKLYDLTRL